MLAAQDNFGFCEPQPKEVERERLRPPAMTLKVPPRRGRTTRHPQMVEVAAMELVLSDRACIKFNCRQRSRVEKRFKPAFFTNFAKHSVQWRLSRLDCSRWNLNARLGKVCVSEDEQVLTVRHVRKGLVNDSHGASVWLTDCILAAWPLSRDSRPKKTAPGAAWHLKSFTARQMFTQATSKRLLRWHLVLGGGLQPLFNVAQRVAPALRDAAV